jgi:hypothetical protein
MNDQPTPSREKLLAWPTERVAAWVAGHPKPLVMGWPPNGTRRWYLALRRRDPSAPDYTTAAIRRQAELHRMAFAHGVAVLLAPCFGKELFDRGPEYVERSMSDFHKLALDAVYREMFAEGVRLRFYGDYETFFDTPKWRPLIDIYRRMMAETASGKGPLLLLGFFADDPAATVARLSVELFKLHDRLPTRRELIEAYYGVPVPDLDLYIFSDMPALFDVPLITNGRENLYATLGPSFDMTERQFREIIYDHLVSRRPRPDVDYTRLPPAAQDELIEDLDRLRGHTLGLGRINPRTGLWQLALPSTPR